MLYREIISVWSQIHTEHINTLCGQNVELLNDKLKFGGLMMPESYSKSLFHGTCTENSFIHSNYYL